MVKTIRQKRRSVDASDKIDQKTFDRAYKKLTRLNQVLSDYDKENGT